MCPPPQEDVADKALAALLVVGLDAMGGEECAERVADLIEHAGLQLTVRAGDDAMGAASIKTNAGLAVFVPPDRELHFIAVAVHLGGGDCGQHRDIQPANAAERVCYVLVFGLQLCLIAEMTQAAAAAGTGGRAVYLHAVGRGGEQLVQNAKRVAAAVFDDLDPRFIAGGSVGYKNGLAVRGVGHAAAVAGKALNAEGQELIFL